MNSSNRMAKANAEPKKTLKNGKVYGGALSAEEKKKIVAQKKKDKKSKKVRKSAQQTIPYVEMCRDGICKVNSRLYTKTVRFNDIILREGKILSLKVGRAYRIPKAHLFTYLCIGCGEAVTA